MGQGNQKCFDLCAGKVGSQRENPLQNGSTLNQAAGANPAFFVPLLVLQNLLSVFKLPNLLQDLDRKSTRLNSSHIPLSRMPSSA